MSGHDFQFCGASLVACANGTLWLPESETLCVSDLHLGKSERIARRAGLMLPPFETLDTLTRLGETITRLNPKTVICLGDSFDDLTAANDLAPDAKSHIIQLQAGRKWLWIEGNHDTGPVDIGGTHVAQTTIGNLTLRHIATDEEAEISGHYHPKHAVAGTARPCFLYDTRRLIMPAFGTYTGGLRSDAAPLKALFPHGAIAVLTGKSAIATPLGKNQRPQDSRGMSY